MDRRYKIILSSPNLYREIELAADAREVHVGTGIDCDVRLHPSLFFGPIELTFVKDGNGEWSILCSENLYVTVGDVRKLMTKQLCPGETLLVRYQESENTAFQIEFFIDFDSGKLRYERSIDVSSCQSFTIGEDASCQIRIRSPFINNDFLTLRTVSGGLELTINRTTYGVYHNGRRAAGRELIRNMDFFSVSDFFFYYKDGKLLTEIRDEMSISRLTYQDHPFDTGYPRFHRSTRLQSVINEEPIQILDPPQKPQKPKSNLFTRLLPSMGMLIAAAVMAIRGGMGMIIMSGISGVMAIITAVLGYREAKKDYKTGVEDRLTKYNAYVENKRKEIEEYREEEKDVLSKIFISQDEECQNFGSFSPALFDRTTEDDDFLCVKLGEGNVEAKRKIEYKKQERLEIEDDLQLIPEQICKDYRYIPEAPVVCDFKKADAIGVVGSPESRFALLKNIVVDLAARHYYSDLRMVFVCEKENVEKIRWLRMLPHVMNDEYGIRTIVTDDESRNAVFEYLYREMSAREQSKSFESRILVFFFDDYGFKSHPISKFVDKSSQLGVTFLFFSASESDTPLGCDYVIDSPVLGKGKLIDVKGKEDPVEFSYSEISTDAVKRIVELLSPVYTEEISLESTLTKNISMFQMLNILGVDDLDLARRWSGTQVFKSMAAPIGVSKSGVVYLDLHDKAHGPHGLVAGTTGSGKSEVLQTYILSMATLFSPYEVAFVIIDFKGGGMVNQFRNLPHLLGAITNIDGKEIDRSLKSIKAELQKRQRLFAEADVNHIDKYIRKYRSGEVSVALPHLILIVDEFAELKAEQPEFMKELISAARIGRSLGVHLILATQKPSGQVNEQIWSNSRFKLCLKVQNQEDSNEVLKSPLAAEIKEPGRAYLQVGNNEIFELFQSAYSGASEKVYDNATKEFSIASLTDAGRKTVVFKQKNQKPGEDSRTQLDAIVDYVADYCEKTRMERLPNIFLPALSATIPFPEDSNTSIPVETTVDLGILDDPDNQYQGVYSVNIESQNMMIIGSSQSGKTNLLQTMIRGLSERYTAEQVNIYIIDFASMVLKNFEGLRHVGGVVTTSEDEKLRNLMKLLFGEIESRKKQLLKVGVSSFTAYREAGFTDLPHIVLMIDNLTALKELYFQDDADLLRLCREGISVGITVIVANAQTSGIGYKYLTNFSSRIALFCNDSSEYGALFDHCREKVQDIRGRCLIDIDKKFMDCQIYLAFDGEKEIERVEKIKNFVNQVNSKQTGRARQIPEIPELLTPDYIVDHFSEQMQQNFSLVVGLDYGTVSPYSISLASQGALAVSGRDKSGKHNFIRYIITMLERVYPGRSAVYIVDGINKRLSDMKEMPNVRQYSFLADRAKDYVLEIEGILKERFAALAGGDDQVLDHSELLVLILNSTDAAEAVSQDSKVMEAYRNILGRYKNLNCFILVGNYENNTIPYGAPEVLKKLKDSRQFMFFDDLSALKILDLPIATVREFKKPIALGDGYLIHDSDCCKLKTVRCR